MIQKVKNRYKEIIIVTLLCSAATIFTGCNAKTVTAAPDIKNVKVVEASISEISTNVEYASKFKPLQEITVSPKTGGKVASIAFNVGDKVNQGDILFTLDGKDIQAQISQQQANLELSKVNLAKTSDSGLAQQLLSAQQAVEKAKMAYDTVKTGYDTIAEDYFSAAVPKDVYTDAQNKLNSAALDLKVAQENLRLLKEKSGPQSIEAANAQVKQAQAGLDGSINQLDNLTIKSPIAGTVSARTIDVGEMSNASMASFTILNTQQLIAEVNLTDKMVQKVQKGQPLKVKVNALDKMVDGTVDSISPAADDKNQMFTVKIKVNNEDNKLSPGMFARVIITTEKKSNILTVPNSVIQFENGISYVLIVEDNIVRKKVVDLGISNDKETEVISNLKKGDKAISEGQIFYNDGEKVTLVK